jgi:Bacteriophage head to tail connecting protein
MAVQRDYRLISDAELDQCRRITKIFSELTTYRNIHAGQWEEAAALIDPDSRNTFFVGSYNFPGMKKTQMQVDASGALALQQFCAIADSMITPKNRLWHGLESDEYVMQDRASRQYFDDVRKIVFNYRYRTTGNFHGQDYRIWKSLGAFGNSIMYVDNLDTRWSRGQPGLRYKACPLGECFFAENHQGTVTTIIRWFRLTAAQAQEKFGEEWLPPTLRPALEQNLQTPFQFLHCVMPREDYEPDRLDVKGMAFSSHYMSIDGQCLVAPEGGYHEFPYAVSRYDQMPGEVYGRGPAQLTLPELKTLNAEKGMFLKTGHRAGDPVLLTADDGLISWDLRPGAINPGGVNSDGKPLVHILPSGEIQITEKMMQESRGIIENMFLTPLFKTLMQNPNMTATQVVELINERAMLVAPTLGRQHSEYAGGLVPREIGLLQRMKIWSAGKWQPVLPPMPDRLREAMGHYEVTDTSPLALQAKSSQGAGALRTLDIANNIANATGDTTVYDYFAFDRMMPAIGEMNEMPTEFSATKQEIAAKQKNRQAQQERAQAIQELPAKAAMLKAQAVASKAPGIGAPQQQPQQQMPA